MLTITQRIVGYISTIFKMRLFWKHLKWVKLRLEVDYIKKCACFNPVILDGFLTLYIPLPCQINPTKVTVQSSGYNMLMVNHS
jgi:hypothetical protein